MKFSGTVSCSGATYRLQSSADEAGREARLGESAQSKPLRPVSRWRCRRRDNKRDWFRSGLVNITKAWGSSIAFPATWLITSLNEADMKSPVSISAQPPRRHMRLPGLLNKALQQVSILLTAYVRCRIGRHPRRSDPGGPELESQIRDLSRYSMRCAPPFSS